MTKHTPGPWTVHVDKSGGDWEYTIRTVKPHNPAGRIGKHIATLNPYLREGTGNELWPCVDHNARLIAAAPELLEALKEQSALLEWAYTQIINLKKPQIQRLIQEQAEHSIGRKFDGYLPASKRARAAIAKAEGGGA